MQSSRLNADVFQQALEQGEFSSCVVITFQVMAVAGVSPGNPYPVRTVPEGRQYELGTYPGRTGHSNDPNVGGILESAHSRKVGCSVTTPVTQEGRDLRLPVVHYDLLHKIAK